MAQHSPSGLGTFAYVMTRLGHRTQLAAAIVAVGLLASACASGSDSSNDGSSGSSIAPPAESQNEQPEATTPGNAAAATIAPDDTPVTAVVPEALRFTAPLVGGGEFTGADYADKPTVFWFWAPT